VLQAGKQNFNFPVQVQCTDAEDEKHWSIFIKTSYEKSVPANMYLSSGNILMKHKG
jgi:hypothetical protein